jgi:hypothetical protein
MHGVHGWEPFALEQQLPLECRAVELAVADRHRGMLARRAATLVRHSVD